MAGAAGSSPKSGRYHKPNRTSQACRPCRARKTRCDGRQPVCLACEKRGIAAGCFYVKDAETDHAGHENARRDGADHRLATSDQTATTLVNGQGPPLGVPSTSSTSSIEPLYRSSSRGAYALRVLPPPKPRTKQLKPSTANLIPRHHADAYVEAYFAFAWPLIPALDRDAFMASYNLLWTEPADPSFNVIALMVFANGVRGAGATPGVDKIRAADSFFAEAKQQLDLFDVVDSPTLEDVQALLLMVQYLHSTGDALRCWTMHGVTFRIAYALAIHREEPASLITPQLNLRRCIWHCCVLLDRFNAVAFGQQMLSFVDTATTPLPVLYVSSEESFPPLSLFVSTFSLSDMLSDLLKLLHTFDCKPPADIAHWEKPLHGTLEISWRLDSFYDGVPDALKTWELPSLGGAALQLQQQVLRCRYLLVRLLAFQPLLMASIHDKGRTQHPTSLLKYGCEECINAAQELADNLWKAMHSPHRSTPWHATYYLFTAAAVMLTATRSSVIYCRPGDSRFDTTWSRSLEVLDAHAEDTPLAGKAASVLRCMRDEVFGTEKHAFEVPCAGVHEPGAKNLPNWIFGTWLNSNAGWEEDIDLGWMQDWFGDIA